ncbi:MAG: phospholipid carrier-dependent glycosyltransferase, partial [Chitinivibrionales bacterium]|nr:phospholipid carrier-dependent glycosyltransferase [Chitinivibrionales bacterium]
MPNGSCRFRSSCILVFSSNHTRFLVFLFCITAVRIFYGAYLGLGDDEAYYWEWGQHLALSYFDHPPLTAWIGRCTCEIFGNNQFGFRSGAIVSSLLFTIFLYLLSLRMFSLPGTALRVSIFVAAIPLFAVGSFMMVPDAFLALFWLLALFFFWEIVDKGNRRDWYALGIIFGLGLLSKYNMVMLP